MKTEKQIRERNIKNTGQILMTQYIHPNGRKKEFYIELPKEICVMAEKQILSCECMPNDYERLVIYSHPIENWNEDEDQEALIFAINKR